MWRFKLPFLSKTTLKVGFIFLFTVFAFTLNAQTIANVGVTISPDNITTAYGDDYTLDSIIIYESVNATDFGESGSNSNSILITPPDGFIFTFKGNISFKTAATTDIAISTAEYTFALAANGESITVTFKTGGTLFQDYIYIEDVVIEPIEGVDSYSSTIEVDVNLDGDGLGARTYEFTGYSMEEPSFDFISYTTSNSCGYAQTDITFEIDGVSSSSIAEVVVSSKTAPGDFLEQVSRVAETYIYTSNSLANTDTNIYISLHFGSGWRFVDSISIDSIDSEAQIKLKNADPVTFNQDPVIVSLYASSVGLGQYINDYDSLFTVNNFNDTLFSIIDLASNLTSPTVIGKTFYPDNAGPGFRELQVSRAHASTGCVTTSPLNVQVIPELITSDDIFCYGIDTAGTEVKVATNTIGIYDADTNVQKTVYKSLKLVYGEEDVYRDFVIPDSSNGGFLIYRFDPSDIFEVMGGISDSIDNVYFRYEIWANINNYDNSINVVRTYNSYPESYARYLCSRDGLESRITRRYDMSYYFEDIVDCECYNTVRTIVSNHSTPIQTEVVQVVRPRNNGFLIGVDSDEAFCPTEELQVLNSNYTIDRISSAKEGVSNSTNEASGYTSWYYTPNDVWNGMAGQTIDTLSLFYIDDNGCAGDTNYSIIVDADSIVDTSGVILNFALEYCPVNDSVPLISNFADVSAIDGHGVTSQDNLYFYNPYYAYQNLGISGDSIAADIYDTVSFFYKDNLGCPYGKKYPITIYPKPALSITTENLCIGDTTLLSAQADVLGSGALKSWEWDLGDGFSLANNDSTPYDSELYLHGGRTIGTYEAVRHKYDKPGIFEIHAKATLTTGCTESYTEQLIIGEHPQIEFSYDNKILSRSTIFTNTTTAQAYDSVATYQWYFDDAAIGTSGAISATSEDAITVQFSEPGVHSVSMRATTGNNCSASKQMQVPVFPVIPLDSFNIYSQAFSEATHPEGWIVSNEYMPEQSSGWEYKELTGAFNDNNKHIDGYIWQTGDSLDIEESGWLESPCFDISELQFPLFSLDVFQSMEEGRDGAVLQYTVNDGETWITLGDEESGTNWYNTAGIFSEPGKTNGENVGWLGWSANTNEWSTARYPLEEVRDMPNNVGCVRFRIAYSSNNYTDKAFEGFAIDNWLISSRKRVVLLEEFVNSAWPSAKSNQINDFIQDESVEVVDMRYHMDNGNEEDVLAYFGTWQDVSARASEYGSLQRGPEAVMDGVIVGDFEYNKAFAKRSLVDPTFAIYNVNLNNKGTKLNVSASIKKISNYVDELYGPHPKKVRIAIVQKEVEASDGNTYSNVVVDLLPSGVGNVVATLDEDFGKNDSINISVDWVPNVSTIGNDYRVVIYVQGWWGVDEVQQVWFKDIATSNVPQVNTTATNYTSANGDSGYTLYPNPVTNKLYIAANGSAKHGINWFVYTASGSLVKEGQSTMQQNEVAIPADMLEVGVYVVKIVANNGMVSTYKIIKTD